MQAELHTAVKYTAKPIVPESRGDKEPNFAEDSSYQEIIHRRFDALPNASTPELGRIAQEFLWLAADNYGFLPDEHSLVQELQNFSGAIRNPDKPYSRVKVLLTSTINAFALPDGTLVMTAGLLNSLTSEELLPIALLHEQAHFESNHHQQSAEYWIGSSYEKSQARVMLDKIAGTGLSRFHEYQADIISIFKAEKVGMDTFALNKLLRHLHDLKEDGGGSDVVHGSSLERELNISLLHSFINFTSSATRLTETPVRPEWRIQIPVPFIDKLMYTADQDEWNKLYNNATPTLRTAFINHVLQLYSLISSSLSGHSNGYKWSEDLSLKSIDELSPAVIRNYAFVISNLAGQMASSEQPDYGHIKRQLQNIFTMFNGAGNKILDERVLRNASDVANPDDINTVGAFVSLNVSDTTPEAMSTLFNTDPWLWLTQLDLVEPGSKPLMTSEFPVVLHSHVMCLKLIEVKLPEETPEDYLERMYQILRYYGAQLFAVRDLSLNSKVKSFLLALGNVLYLYRRELLKPYDVDEISYEWAVAHGKQRLFEGILEKHCEVIRKIHKEFPQLGSDGLERYKEKTHRLITNKYDTKTEVSTRYVEQLMQSLLPAPDEELLMQIKDASNSEVILSELHKDPKEFLQRLAVLKQHYLISDGDRVGLTSLLVDNMSKLPPIQCMEIDRYDKHAFMSIYEPEFNLNREQEYGILFSQALPNPEKFNQLTVLLEAVFILITGLPAQQKLKIVNELFRQGKVAEVFLELPLIAKDVILLRCIRDVVPSSDTRTGESGNIRSAADKYQLEEHVDYDLRNSYKMDKIFNISNGFLDLTPLILTRNWILEDISRSSDLKQVVDYDKYLRNILRERVYGIGMRGSYILNEPFAAFIAPVAEELYQRISELKLGELSFSERISLYRLAYSTFKPTTHQLQILSAFQGHLLTDKSASLEQVTSFLEEEISAGRIAVTEVSKFVQQWILSRDDFEYLEARIIEMVSDINSQTRTKLGIYAFLDYILSKLSDRVDMVDLLEAVLFSDSNDIKLRAMLATAYSAMDSISEVASDKTQQEDGDNRFSSADIFMRLTFEEFENQIYTLSPLQKSFLLRKIFLSPGGIFSSKEQREKLAELMLAKLDYDPQLSPLVHMVIRSAVKVMDPVKSFPAIANALEAFILIPPQTKTPLSSVADYVFRNRLVNKQPKDLLRDLSLQRSEIDTHLKTTPVTSRAKDQIDRIFDQIAKFSGYQEPSKTSNHSISTLEAIKKLAQPLAPIGPAFLQIIGQFVDLDSRLDELMDVYDNNPGQLTFSIHRTLKSLSKKDPQIAKFYYERFRRLGNKLGGGKLATTYESVCEYDDGVELTTALKVANPNVERYLYEVKAELDKVIAQLKLDYPEHKKDFALAENVLEIVYKWILDEISSQSVFELDQPFQDHLEKMQKSSGLRVGSPQRFEPQTLQVRNDKYISGETLGREISSSDNSRHKKLVAEAQVKAIMYTLGAPVDVNGQKVYLVLKDPSFGNTIVTIDADGAPELALIDRQYEILSAADVQFIRALFESRTNPLAIYVAFRYLLNLPENREFKLRSIMNRANMAQIAELFNQARSSHGDLKLVNAVIIYLNEIGLKIPDRIRKFLLKTPSHVDKLFEMAGVDNTFARCLLESQPEG